MVQSPLWVVSIQYGLPAVVLLVRFLWPLRVVLATKKGPSWRLALWGIALGIAPPFGAGR